MTTFTQDDPLRVTGGVDTHKDADVAAVIEHLGGLLDIAEFGTTMCSLSVGGCRGPVGAYAPWS